MIHFPFRRLIGWQSVPWSLLGISGVMLGGHPAAIAAPLTVETAPIHRSHPSMPYLAQTSTPTAPTAPTATEASPANRNDDADDTAPAPGCPTPALERVNRHIANAGDTVASLAAQYGLLPTTILGFNSDLGTGAIAAGQTVLIPPYNGIRATVPSGSTWQDVAAQQGVRADVLFEVNGCVATPPRTIFVPGVNWLPNGRTATTPPQHNLNGYPLPNPAPIALGYGWQSAPEADELVFSSGVGLAVTTGTPVLAVGAGTVAFVGEQAGQGTLIVINHPQGLQTRYAQLQAATVQVGQTVSQGQTIGATRSLESGQSFLYFEVRSNSALGWVAEDPGRYIQQLAIR